MTRHPPPSALAWYRYGQSWRIILIHYLPILGALNLAWETAQLPLYTIWKEAPTDEIIFAVWHCTLGDLLIGALALAAALTLTQARDPTAWQLKSIILVAVAGSVAYTIFSEWLNVNVRQSWAYSELMPVIPIIGTGLSPVLQWVLIPPIAIALATYRRKIRAPC